MRLRQIVANRDAAFYFSFTTAECSSGTIVAPLVDSLARCPPRTTALVSTKKAAVIAVGSSFALRRRQLFIKTAAFPSFAAVKSVVRRVPLHAFLAQWQRKAPAAFSSKLHFSRANRWYHSSIV